MPTTNVTASNLVWQVNGITGGNSTVGTVSTTGLYTAPATGAETVTVSVSDMSDAGVTASAQVYVIAAGAVSTTANGQVASYTINLPATGTVSVEFGTGTTYGRSTWQVASPSGGGATTVLVAGMLANTAYHMRADVTLGNGVTFDDSDKTFTTTQSIPTSKQPVLTATTAAGQTPQPGVELMDSLDVGPVVYDLQGNLLWGYTSPEISKTDQLQPVKFLANGHMLMQITPGSSYPIFGPAPSAGAIWEIREIDLANNVIRDLTMDLVQANLTANGFKDQQGNTPQLTDIHHDVMINPVTGHWVLDGNYLESVSNLTGYSGPVSVLGDILMDVDPNNNFAVTWVWSTFDHLDVNRHPYQFPDWTHSNAVVYSATDHNLLLSMRHQNWVLKINYQDGSSAGDGTIKWRLGYQGDFTLVNGSEPQDWNFAQHLPSFTTPATAGVFGLTLMDNGTDRLFPTGYTCGAPGNLPCLYSRTPIFTLDETAMTATLGNASISPYYNIFGGNAEVLANGNEQADFCGVGTGSALTETTVGDNPQPVWTLQTTGTNIFIGHRLPSLYPGVQW